MRTRNHRLEQRRQTTHAGKSVFAGFLVGSALGAATALLFAPRSGEETRTGIRDKAVELRDRTTDTVKDTVSQAKSKASEIKDNVLDKADELKERGKQTLSHQLDRVSHASANAKDKVQEY